MLQWGRGFSTAEMTCIRAIAVVGTACFNGAAVSQPRKSPFHPTFPPNRHRFNGAAVSQPRKLAGQALTPPKWTQLQWGRGFSTAEMAAILTFLFSRT